MYTHRTERERELRDKRLLYPASQDTLLLAPCHKIQLRDGVGQHDHSISRCLYICIYYIIPCVLADTRTWSLSLQYFDIGTLVYPYLKRAREAPAHRLLMESSICFFLFFLVASLGGLLFRIFFLFFNPFSKFCWLTFKNNSSCR